VTLLVVRHHTAAGSGESPDVFAPGLALALFFMRLGCLLNGCDYGIATMCPGEFPLHGAPGHRFNYTKVWEIYCFPILLVYEQKTDEAGASPFLTYLC
jgi:prolipoprotein diacylglyceryltransferase